MTFYQKILACFLLFLWLNVNQTFAQYPYYFSYDNEYGLPSNEVYSIVQDKKGFVWIGCDAGLFKFDGLRYIAYKCKSQTSKSIAGLTISSSGKIYCYNFKTQLFCLENDSLKEIKHTLPKRLINNLVSDNQGNIYATHLGGIARYNEKNEEWINYFDYGNIEKYGNNFWVAKSIKGNERNDISFIYSKGIAQIDNNNIQQINSNNLFSNDSAGKFEIENHQNTLWIFSKETNLVYRFSNNKLEEISNSKLNELLAGRKITNVKALSDNNLWICTYRGIIQFNPQTNENQLLYPQLSFSDCLIDREGNYWFTTLQNGVLRVPDLAFRVWDAHQGLSQIANDSQYIYFANGHGQIGQFDINTENLQLFSTEYDADVQSFDYVFSDKKLLFNINNHLFELAQNSIREINNFNIQAIKAIQKVKNDIFTLSSHGVFINGKSCNLNWARQMKYDSIHQSVWIASNGGLLKFVNNNGAWLASDTLFSGTQILSIDFDAKEKQLYALSFNGKILEINANNAFREIAVLPENMQANKILSHNQKLYLATNAGIAIFDLKTQPNKTFKLINRLSGLVSDNIQDIAILKNNLWLATTKGFQQIPLSRLATQKSLAQIYLKNNASGYLQLNYDQSLALFPEVSAYSSNGQFEYAYRINQRDWIKLPASIEEIIIDNLPAGNFEIELKAIDHLGRDSEKIISLKGYVRPPFWQRWWFSLIIVFICGSIIFLFVKRRIKLLKQKQEKEIERIQLENELRLSRETALKSQMNPHFVFNVLNSIKLYIYKNDKQNASAYLNKFSDLMRTFLSMSNKTLISLADELKMLELYIALETMLLKDDFTFEKSINADIDLEQTFIPSLIVQPFVENAFKHGLHNKNGAKKLALSINKSDENYIIIEISDNGIGRKAAQQIKEAEKLQHESFATTAIEKRIELLNRNQQIVSVFICDLQDENSQQAAGTAITIKIKINE